jgi:hypothetical protein
MGLIIQCGQALFNVVMQYIKKVKILYSEAQKGKISVFFQYIQFDKI